MHKIVSVAFIVVIIGGLIFAMEALYGNIKGNGLVFVGICTGIASIFLFIAPDSIQEISSGFNKLENLTFDTSFTKLEIDGKMKGSVSDLKL